jgi:hypothetical protein
MGGLSRESLRNLQIVHDLQKQCGFLCRRQSNRVSAQRSRARKAQELQCLNEHLAALEDTCCGLQATLDEARSQEARIKQDILTLRETRLALVSQVWHCMMAQAIDRSYINSQQNAQAMQSMQGCSSISALMQVIKST